MPDRRGRPPRRGRTGAPRAAPPAGRRDRRRSRRGRSAGRSHPRCPARHRRSPDGSRVQPQCLHALGVRVGDPLDQAGDAGQIARARDDNSASSSRSATMRCAWVTASPSEPPAPQRQPVAHLPVGRARRPHLALGERACPVSASTSLHQRPGVARDQGGDLPVEVGGEPVAHVGLDQRLEPAPAGSRRGRSPAGRRRGPSPPRWSRPCAQVVVEPAEVADLRRRHRDRAARPASVGACRASSASRSKADSSA